LAALSLASYVSSSLSQTPRPDYLASPEAFRAHIQPLLDYLYTARPTAVNLGVATRRIEGVLNAAIAANKSVEKIAQDVIEEGRRVNDEDVGRNKSMAKWGGEWLIEQVKAQGGTQERLNVMTVCNTGSLATSVSMGFGPASRCLWR
jgi:methylthioribose-1-phosphate isomerase